MTARAFHFLLGKCRCFAQGHPSSQPKVTLSLNAGDEMGETVGLTVRMSPHEARQAAATLWAAADHAEATLPTGLGESAVTS